MAQRAPKQSQLDYLWVNFGEYSISSPTSKDDEDKQLPTVELVNTLLESIKDQALNSLKIIGNYLIGYSINGNEINRIDISEFKKGGNGDSTISGNTIESYGTRYITKTDVSNGCQFLEGTAVRYLRLSDGSEFITGAEGYSGAETNSVIITITGNQISAELKLDNENSVIELSNKSNKGLRADLKVDNNSSIKLTKSTDGLKAETDAYYTKDQIDEKLAGKGMDWNELI